MLKKKLRKYCLKSFNKLWKECQIQAKEECNDMNDMTYAYEIADQLMGETISNPYDIAGYYIYYYEDEALKQWIDNTQYIEPTKTDKKVTKLLEKIFK